MGNPQHMYRKVHAPSHHMEKRSHCHISQLTATALMALASISKSLILLLVFKKTKFSGWQKSKFLHHSVAIVENRHCDASSLCAPLFVAINFQLSTDLGYCCCVWEKKKEDKSPEHKRFHRQSANTKWTFSLVLQFLFEPFVLLHCLLKRRLHFWSFVLLPVSKESSSREKSESGEEGGRRRQSRPGGCFLWKSCKFSTRALVCSFRYARLTWAWGSPAVSSHLPMPIKPCGAGSFPVIGLVSAPTMCHNLLF